MDDRSRVLIESLFEAFNRRDEQAIADLCDDCLEFHAVTAEEAGRRRPYAGKEGLSTYLADVAKIWEDLLITPKHVEAAGGALLVRGRVYLRSRALGIRDMPVAWIWDVRGELFVRGRVFADPEEAIRVFSREARPEPTPDPGASR